MIINEQWTRLEHVNDIPIRLDTSLLSCSDMMFDNAVSYSIDEYSKGYSLTNLDIQLLESRVSVYQGTMSRKVLKKEKGNVVKSQTLNQFLKQMRLKEETIDNIINLFVLLKGDEKHGK